MTYWAIFFAARRKTNRRPALGLLTGRDFLTPFAVATQPRRRRVFWISERGVPV
jgi:hypothetical protein